MAAVSYRQDKLYTNGLTLSIRVPSNWSGNHSFADFMLEVHNPLSMAAKKQDACTIIATHL